MRGCLERTPGVPRLALTTTVFSDQPGQVTLNACAGDAVVMDYRLLHGTHANASVERRDCVLLSFTPSWGSLPCDIRAHLVQHLAQPTEAERRELAAGWATALLPNFAGIPADLELNQTAPPQFAVNDRAPRHT